jgi:hypothetical protein
MFFAESFQFLSSGKVCPLFQYAKGYHSAFYGDYPFTLKGYELGCFNEKAYSKTVVGDNIHGKQASM